jgi:hypothetical protein
MMHVQLPDRKEITLREAVTAFVYRESRDASSGPFYPSFASEALLEQLHNAAQAGRVRFRALKIGDNKYQEIEPVYFSTRCKLNWTKNEILSWGPIDERECKPVYDGQECDEVLGVDWHDVHLDREQFASLLMEMGVSIRSAIRGQLSSDPNEPGEQVTDRTGDPGRRTSKHLYEAEARRRLDAGDVPGKLTEFSEQIADWIKRTHPLAARPTPKTIANRIRPLWHDYQKRPK